MSTFKCLFKFVVSDMFAAYFSKLQTVMSNMSEEFAWDYLPVLPCVSNACMTSQSPIHVKNSGNCVILVPGWSISASQFLSPQLFWLACDCCPFEMQMAIIYSTFNCSSFICQQILYILPTCAGGQHACSRYQIKHKIVEQTHFHAY